MAGQDPEKKAPPSPVISHFDPKTPLANRIRTSASALLQETILRPQPEYAMTSLAALSSATSKGSSSTNSSGIPPPPSHGHFEQISPPSSDNAARSTGSFRTQSLSSSDSIYSVQHEFDLFSANRLAVSNTKPARIADLDENMDTKGKQKSMPEEDGTAVILLLSKPSFSTKGTSYMDEEFDLTGAWGYHQNKRQMLGLVKRDMVDPQNGVSPSAAHSLSLLPNFDRDFKPSADASDEEIRRTEDSDAVDGVQMYASSAGPDVSQRPWLDILTKYTDEVWGDMLPLVEEARKEIQDMRKGEEAELYDRPAIRRLGMILGHITRAETFVRTN
ncbi:hypothetical protein MMC19_002961 [Ptychographa xylographoides]|nr:hypothetical protein [Ptychographa xylographoides]